jgi:putative ABC transport system ATP-binding protein
MGSMERSAAISIDALRFAWPGNAPILDIEHFAVASGERLFLQGASGSGKSTLLGLIGGVLQAQHGRICVLGSELTTLSASARDRFRGAHLGFVFQMFNLIPYLSLLDNVTLPARFSPERSLGGDLNAEARRLLAALGLTGEELLARSVTQLSIGQQQRVAAARALLGAPPIIIADEPTSALDHLARADFLQLLLTQCANQSSTLLFVSHDTSLGAMFDRVVDLQSINRAAAAATGRA